VVYKTISQQPGVEMKIFFQSQIIQFFILGLIVVQTQAQTVDIEAFSEQSYQDALEQEAFSIGVQAYIYGRAPMLSYEWRYTELWNESFTHIKGDMNQINHFRQPWNPDMGGAAANGDVTYSEAWMDLSKSAYVLDMTREDERYVSVIVYDFYTNTVGFLGDKKLVKDKTSILVTGPDWHGDIPAGIDHRIISTTPVGYTVIRTFVKDANDLENVYALQETYCITPLTSWYPGIVCEDGRGQGSRPAEYSTPQPFDLSDPLNYFVYLTDLLRENPPPQDEKGLMRIFSRLNIGPGQNFDKAKLQPAVKAGLLRAISTGKRIIDMAIQTQLTEKSDTGWDVTYIDKQYESYLRRAVIAKSFPHALTSEGALYQRVFVDHEGNRLNGKNRYSLHFSRDQVPVDSAFWSLSIYDDKTRFVKNEIDRYSISDRTKGISFAKDGSLTIYIQNEKSEKLLTNWLPAPFGDFFMALRVYEPSLKLRSNKFIPPSVKRLQ